MTDLPESAKNQPYGERLQTMVLTNKLRLSLSVAFWQDVHKTLFSYGGIQMYLFTVGDLFP